MKDLVDNNLSLGDKCYYIHNTKDGWNLAIVEVVEFKAKTLIVKFVDVNPCEEYESKIITVGTVKVIYQIQLHHLH